MLKTTAAAMLKAAAAVRRHLNTKVAAAAAAPPVLVVPEDLEEVKSSLGFNYYRVHKDDDKWCAGSCHGHLAFVSKKDLSFYFARPNNLDDDDDDTSSSSSRVVTLPPLYSLPHVLGFSRDDGGSFDEIVTEPNSKNPDGDPDYCSPRIFARKCILRLATSSSPEQDDCTVMAAYDCGFHLGFCKLNSSSTPCSWTRFGDRSLYQDVAFSTHHNLFFTVQRTLKIIPRLVAWDLTHHSNPKQAFTIESIIGSSPDLPPPASKLAATNYLVDCGDHLLLVARYSESFKDDGHGNLVLDNDKGYRQVTLAFHVYRVDSDRRALECLDTIGNKALFVGMNQAFALDADDIDGLRPNSVYFTDDDMLSYIDDSEESFMGPLYDDLRYGGHDSGICNLTDFTITPLVSLLPGSKRIFPSPIWLARKP